MIPIDKKIQGSANLLLVSQGWNKQAIAAALIPTPKQAEERTAGCVAEVNPEQQAAISMLHRFGWGSHTIAQAMPVNEHEVARVLHKDWLDKEWGKGATPA
jgi:DNA-directed RNA polymerase specialized sigma24 family protein